MPRPFEDVRDGLPCWPLKVENPSAALQGRVELVWKALGFPQGGVLALAVKLYDTPGRPAIYHHALAMGSPSQMALVQAGALRLVFQRQGWMEESEKTMALDLGSLPSLAPGSQVALAAYVDAYTRALAKAGTPEGAWEAIEQDLRLPVAARAKSSPTWLKGLLALLLLGLAAGLAWLWLRP